MFVNPQYAIIVADCSSSLSKADTSFGIPTESLAEIHRRQGGGCILMRDSIALTLAWYMEYPFRPRSQLRPLRTRFMRSLIAHVKITSANLAEIVPSRSNLGRINGLIPDSVAH